MRILKSNFLNKIAILFFWLLIFIIFLFSPLLKKEVLNKSINVLTWGSLIDRGIISAFEKRTGIKVNLSYYETNDELFAKLLVSQGREYDLITITDAGLDFFKENDLIKKIDKSRINFMDEIDPHMFGHYFDENYEYSLPLCWDIFGLGINKKFFNTVPSPTWKLIFDKQFSHGKISMTDDAMNAVLITAQYLFGKVKNIDQTQLKKIKEQLINQKKMVEIYTELRADYMLKTDVCPIAATQCSYIYRVIRDDPKLSFMIPKEGGFKIIDLLIIPKNSKNDDHIYKFIEFLFQEKIAKKHFELFGYLPSQKKLLYNIDLHYLGGIDHIFSEEIFSKLEFFDSNVTASEANEIWAAVKA